MGISTPGIGSGLDVNSIVSKLLQVDSQPLTLLARQEAADQAKLSAIGSISGALSTFQTATRGLSDLTKYQATKVAIGDATIASASSSTGAVPGTYALEVSQLAQAQKLAAAGQASTATAIGSGTLSFDFGTISGGTFANGSYSGASFSSNGSGVKTVTINPTNNSLAGIRDAINSAKIGVTATIVNDGSASPNRLVLTQGSTGASNSLKISVSGDAALSNLLSQDPAGAQFLSETSTAQNALLKVDGVSISKTANSVSDVIQGVTLNLTGKSAPGISTNVSVNSDSSGIVSALTQFVTAYNQTNKTLRDVSSFNPATKQAGILNGDSSIRSIQAQIRNVLNAPVSGSASVYNVLSQVGVTLQKDGSLTLDNAKLQAAVTSNPNSISSLFAAVGTSTDSLVNYASATGKTKVGQYAVSISQIAQQGSATGLSAVSGAASGSTTGSSSAGLTIDNTNNSLTVLLDGVSSNVTLTSGVYASAAALATNVQSQINANPAFSGAGSAVTVTNNLGVLTIASNKTGSSSAINITGGNGKTNLLGVSPSTNAGYDTAITAGVNDTLLTQINGVSSSITLAAGKYSFSSLATALQGQINGASAFSNAGVSVNVTQTAGVLKVASNTFGAQSAVSFSGGNSLSTLFGGTPTSAAGLDVAGSINGKIAVGSGKTLTGATGDASEGLAVSISGTTLGARGTVNYSQGYAFKLDQLITDVLGSSGIISARTAGINAAIKTIGQRRNELNTVLAANEKRYRAQFNALDTVINGLQGTSAFLSQQLANLPKI